MSGIFLSDLLPSTALTGESYWAEDASNKAGRSKGACIGKDPDEFDSSTVTLDKKACESGGSIGELGKRTCEACVTEEGSDSSGERAKDSSEIEWDRSFSKLFGSNFGILR